MLWQWRATTRALTALAVVCLILLWGGCKQEPTEIEVSQAPRPPQGATVSAEEEPIVDWKLTSTAFASGERIPAQYTADGQDVSPPLKWTEPPPGTVELVLICDDPDAPVGTWNHWIVYDLSAEVTEVREALPTDATVAEPALKQGVNSFGNTGYGGPSPPPGKPHRYQFTLYALREPTDLPAGTSKQQVLAALEGKVLAKTMLEGIYSR